MYLQPISSKQHRALWIAALSGFLLSLRIFFGAPAMRTMAFLDVGQGDATLITTAEGRRVLVDTGPGSAILDALGRELGYFGRRIDLLVLTHPHRDHTGGAPEVLERFRVGRLLVTGVASDEASYLETLRIARERDIPVLFSGETEILQVGSDLFLERLFPPTEAGLLGLAPRNPNNTSVVLRGVVSADGTRKPVFLLMGDAEAGAEEALMAAHPDLHAPLIKIGHHGSKTASGVSFLERVRPSMAVISTGAENRFGFPHAETLKALSGLVAPDCRPREGSGVCRTDRDGTILVDYGKMLML